MGETWLSVCFLNCQIESRDSSAFCSFWEEMFLNKNAFLGKKSTHLFPGGCSSCYVPLVPNGRYWRNACPNRNWAPRGQVSWSCPSTAWLGVRIGSFFPSHVDVSAKIPACRRLHLRKMAVTWVKDCLLVCCAWCMGNLAAISSKFIGCTVIKWRAMTTCKAMLGPSISTLLSLWTEGAAVKMLPGWTVLGSSWFLAASVCCCSPLPCKLLCCTSQRGGSSVSCSLQPAPAWQPHQARVWAAWPGIWLLGFFSSVFKASWAFL